MKEAMIDEGELDIETRKLVLPSSVKLVSEIEGAAQEIIAGMDSNAPKRVQERVQLIAQETSLPGGTLADMFGLQLANAIPYAGKWIVGMTGIAASLREVFRKKALEDTFERVATISRGYLERLAGKKETHHSVGRTLCFTVPTEIESGSIQKSVLGALIHTQIESLMNRQRLSESLCIDKTIQFAVTQVLASNSQLKEAWDSLYKDQSLTAAVQNEINQNYMQIAEFHNTVREKERQEEKGREFHKPSSESKFDMREVIQIIGAKEFSKASMYYMLSKLIKNSDQNFTGYDLEKPEQASELIAHLNQIYEQAVTKDADFLERFAAISRLGRTLSLIHDGVYGKNETVVSEKSIFQKERIRGEILRPIDKKDLAKTRFDIVIGDTVFQLPAYVTFEDSEFEWIGKGDASYNVLSTEVMAGNSLKVIYKKDGISFEKIFYPVNVAKNHEGQTLIRQFLNTINTTNPFTAPPLDLSRNDFLKALSSYHDLDEPDQSAVRNSMSNTIGVIAFRPFTTFDEALNVPDTPELVYFDVQIDDHNVRVNADGIFYHLMTDGEDALLKMDDLVQVSESDEFQRLLGRYSKQGRPLAIDFTKTTPELSRKYSPTVKEGIANLNIDTNKILNITRAINIAIKAKYGEDVPFRATVSSVLTFVGSALVASKKEELMKTMKIDIDIAKDTSEVLSELRKGTDLPDLLVGNDLIEYLKTLQQSEARTFLANLTDGGKYDIVTPILSDLPKGVPPFPGTAQNSGAIIPGSRLIGTVAQLPLIGGEERRAFAKNFWEVVKLINEPGQNYSSESLRDEWDNLSRVVQACIRVILAEREAGLVGQNISALVQEDLDKAGVVGDLTERFSIELKTAQQITNAIAGGPSIQHNGGTQGFNKKNKKVDYVPAARIQTSGLRRVQLIRHSITTARAEDGSTAVGFRYIPEYSYSKDEHEMTELAQKYFREAIHISIAKKNGLDSETSDEKINEIMEKANNELENQATPELIEAGGRIVLRSILNQIAHGYLVQMDRAVNAMHFMSQAV